MSMTFHCAYCTKRVDVIWDSTRDDLLIAPGGKIYCTAAHYNAAKLSEAKANGR